jgi:hypothetical protein
MSDKTSEKYAKLKLVLDCLCAECTPLCRWMLEHEAEFSADVADNLDWAGMAQRFVDKGLMAEPSAEEAQAAWRRVRMAQQIRASRFV